MSGAYPSLLRLQESRAWTWVAPWTFYLHIPLPATTWLNFKKNPLRKCGYIYFGISFLDSGDISGLRMQWFAEFRQPLGQSPVAGLTSWGEGWGAGHQHLLWCQLWDKQGRKSEVLDGAPVRQEKRPAGVPAGQVLAAAGV